MKTKRIQVRLCEEDYQIIKENLIDKNVNISEEVRRFLIELATGEEKINDEKIKDIITDEYMLNYLCYQIKKKID